MKIRFASENEISSWSEFLVKNPDGGHNLQTKEFAEVKRFNGWSPRFIVIDDLYVLTLEKSVPMLGKIWYTPKGPGIANLEQLGQITKEFKEFAKENGVFLVKFEPELVKNEQITNKKIAKLGLISNKGIQAPNTVIVDISKNIDEIVAGFSSKTRYNIRSAKKADVVSELIPINDKTCAEFYEMMKVTVYGKAILRKFDYYKNFWKLHAENNSGFFMFAKYNNEILAMDFITTIGHKAVRKDAASPRERAVRGTSALLEQDVIEYLKTQGITTYDLCSCPPSDQIKNQNHPFYGIGVFKTGFNENVTDYIGCLDLIINKNAYLLWNKIGEKIALKLFYYIKKDLFY